MPTQDESSGTLVGFAATAALVGTLTGLMAASFRLALDSVSDARVRLLILAQGNSWLGLLLAVIICATAAALAAALVHRIEPHTEGSGIPRVEAVVEGRIPPGSPRILPVKYIGGLLSMGAGLALGREGPSVQMGGNIGIIVSRLTHRNADDLRVLVAAGAAAGLATAFNAPIAGGVFVLEELLRRFQLRTTVATLLASAAGFASSSLLTGGTEQMFQVGPLAEPQLSHAPGVLVLGIVAGLLGVLYNKSVLLGQDLAAINPLPREVWAAIVGSGIAAVGFSAPRLIGGGDALTQEALLATGGILTALGILSVRFVLGVVSYTAATPGGLFAPMLVLGSQLGLLTGLLGQAVAPGWAPEPAALALIGMAAFFTATVRAPLTGIVLVTEMTGAANQLPPMLGACAIAMLVATALRDRPLYDALSARSARAVRRNARVAASKASR